MFCGKCGYRLSDEAAFCPSCGAPVESEQQSGAKILSESEPSANPAPAGNAGQYSWGNAAPPVFNGALQANETVGREEFAFDKKRAVRGVFSHALFGAFIDATAICLALFVVLKSLSGGFLGPFTTKDILFLILFYIGVGIICALLLIIPEAIVVIRRFKDPNDPAYKMGTVPDKEKEKYFERKYTLFRKLCGGIIGFIALVFACYLVYCMQEPLLAVFGDPDLLDTADPSSSETHLTDPAGRNTVSETAYFADNYFDTTVILEPSGDCAYFFSPASGPGVYYYGHYTINGDRVDATFYFSETEQDFPETAVSFEMSDNALVYHGEEKMHLYPGDAFERREEAPGEVQDRPPTYTAVPYAIGWTIQEATVILDEFFTAVPNAPGKIEYKETVIVGDRCFFVFEVEAFRGMDAMPAVDAGSGEVFALHADDGSALSNAYIPLGEWLENGAQGFDHWENEASGQPEAGPAVHTLTEAEIAALWQKMDGAWLIADDTGLTNQAFIFTRLYDGAYGLSHAIIGSDGAYSYRINEVTEQNGVYQLLAYEASTSGSVAEFEQDVREVITLILWEQDGAIEVSASRPDRYGHEFLYESGEFDVWGVHYRSLTADEAELLRNSPDGYVELANGDFLTKSDVLEPSLCYYVGSIEDAYSYLYG